MMLFRFRKKRKSPRRQSRRGASTLHYKTHKEFARSVIHERIYYWNQLYQFSYNRVAIRSQKRCWGSCSAKKNLNFNYKLIFIPEYLMDYVIVHELCHLAHLNHGELFWKEVEKHMPDYRERKAHLHKITMVPKNGFPSSVIQQKENAVTE